MGETHVSAEVVSAFAKEFSLESLDKMDQDDLSDLPAVQPSDTIAVGSSGMIETISQEEVIEEENMEEDDDDDEAEDEENIGQLSKRVTFQANVKNGKENGHKS